MYTWKVKGYSGKRGREDQELTSAVKEEEDDKKPADIPSHIPALLYSGPEPTFPPTAHLSPS